MQNELVVLDHETRQVAIAAMHEHRSKFSPFRGYDEKIFPDTELVPVRECHAVIARIEADKVPAGDNLRTRETVDLVIGSFPFTKESAERLEDPDKYLAALTFIFAKYPVQFHQRVVEEIITSCEFRPIPAEVNKMFERHLARWTMAQVIAKRHLKEHERRQAEQARKATIEAESAGRAEFIQRMGEKFGSEALKMAQAAQGRTGSRVKPFSAQAEEEADLKRFQQDRQRLDRQAEQLKARAAE
ncbi:hypothetical protein [Terasakiella pusilla]|uniref:hypothetical protein n=1 Tax=Terasakiella pusilla TaxID=64973 RepID=UPI003AA96320